MDELRRSRVSLGVSSLQEKENALAAPVSRKRAMSIAGTRVVSPRSQARRSLVPRKSILKQHVPVPAIADDDQAPTLGAIETGGQDFEQSISDAASSLRGSRKSEVGRRVSFAANAQVRLFDKQQGSPSPSAISPPNRASFASDQEPALSSIKRRSVSLPRRRSSLFGSSPDREREAVTSPPNPAPIPFPLGANGVGNYEDDDSDMDIDDPADGVPHEAVDDSYMSIAATEFNQSPTPHSQADGVDMTGDISDMSIAATTYPGSGRESLATNAGQADAFAGPSSPKVVSHDEPPISHEFVVPVGRHIPRTDSDGNVLSPTPAEKAKAAALESLGKFSRESGGNADPENDDDDDEEGPVVPIRIGNDMSIEDASRRIRAASEGLDFDDGGDQTMSTVSSESTGDITGKGLAEATINITAMRKSLPPTIDITELPTPSLPESVPFPSISPSKLLKGPGPPPLAIFTPATPTRSTSVPPRSPTKPPSFTAAFAPSVVTPRKRALSAPSPSPSPAKKRAAGPSSSKPTNAVPINIFQTSPAKLPPTVIAPSKSSFPRPASPAKVSKPAPTPAMPEVRNPFAEPATSQPAPQAKNAPSSANVNATSPGKDERKSVISNTRLSVGPRPSLTIAGSASSLPSSSIRSVDQAPRRRISSIFRNRRSSVVPTHKDPLAPSENTPAHSASNATSGSSGTSAEVISTSRLPDPPPTIDADTSPSTEHDASGKQRSRFSSGRRFSLAPRGRTSHTRRSVTNNMPIPLPPPEIPPGGTPSKEPEEASTKPSRPRSTFHRASFPPAPRTSLSQSTSGPKSQSDEYRRTSTVGASPGSQQPVHVSLAEFVKATGHEFREVPEPRDVIIRPPNPGEESESVYKLSDIIKATMIHYPQLDLYESSVAEMKDQLEILKAECEEMHAQADKGMPDVILDWLEADEEEREMIKTATQIRKSNASLQAQATWISWRHANALKALETAQIHDEELVELDRKLEHLDGALPAALAALEVEHDKLKAELKEEQAIVQEIESCDKAELDEFLAELEAQNAEIEDAAATVRQTKVYLDTLEQKEREVRAQVNAARAAIDAANSIVEQTRVDSPEEAARLKGKLEAFQYLHSWRLGRMRSDLFEIKYDSRMSVSVTCKDYDVESVSIALLPGSAEPRSQFSLLNVLMLSFGERAVSDLGKPKNIRDIVIALDQVWSSLTRVGIELQTLRMWPLQIERYGDYGLRATARVLLKTAGGRADVIFLFTEQVLRSWPAKVLQLGFEVDVKYGTATHEEVLSIISDNLGVASPADCYNILAEACAGLREAYDPSRRPPEEPATP